MARDDLVTLPVRTMYDNLPRRLRGPGIAATQQGYGIELPMGQEQPLLMPYLCYRLKLGGSLAAWASRRAATPIRMLAGRAIDRESSLAACRERVGLGGENGVESGSSMILSPAFHCYYWMGYYVLLGDRLCLSADEVAQAALKVGEKMA